MAGIVTSTLETYSALIGVSPSHRTFPVFAPGSSRSTIIALAMMTSYNAAAGELLPTGGSIVGGAGSISQTFNSMTVAQSTAKMVADWQTFDIGHGNSVNFVQPSASSIALNRVLGSDVSVIQGNLTANGQVFLINPNGVLFSPTAQVNVGGLVASTLNISTADFRTGNFKFAGDSSSGIVNQGNITAVNGGTIALIAAKITNIGDLTANAGNVLLSSGAQVTLDLGGPIKLQVTQAALDALIQNGGAIKADGGLVYLSAQAAGDLASTVINTTGVIEARSLATGETGQIMLMAGMASNRIVVDGTLDASAPNGGKGGFIETSAAHVQIADSIKVTTLATDSNSGTWLIDPVDFNIGDANDGALSNLSGTTLSTNLESGNVDILSSGGTADGSGNINVNEAVSWSANLLTLTAANDININAVMTASGTSTLAMNTATANGDDVAAAGGHVLVGMDSNGFTGRVDFSNVDGTSARSGTGLLTINALDYDILNSIDQLAAMAITGNFAVGVNLGAPGSTFSFMPIASFADSFNGLGHTITGMNIDGASAANIGLIKIAGAASDIRNVGLVDGVVSGGAGTGSLVGSATTGTVSNSYNSGNVTGAAGTGGLLGSMTTGQVSNSYNTGSVIGHAGTGGLIGAATLGTVSNSYNSGNVTGAAGTGGLLGGMTTGQVSHSHSTGNVTGTAGTGGLIGTTTGAVSESYATGQVHGAAGTGGLIGTTTGAVSKSYATGQVHGAAGTGGLIGTATGDASESYATGQVDGTTGTGGLIGTSTGSITNTYAGGSVTAPAPGGLFGSTTGALTGNFWILANADHSVGDSIATPAGTTGLASANMKATATFPAGWNFTDTWFIDEGNSYPLLRNFMADLTVTANNDSRTYGGVAYSGGNGLTYSDVNATPAGTLSYTGTSQGSISAGSYSIKPGGLATTQQGYIYTYVDGTLTIAKADATVTANSSNTIYTGLTQTTSGFTGPGLVIRDIARREKGLVGAALIVTTNTNFISLSDSFENYKDVIDSSGSMSISIEELVEDCLFDVNCK